MVNSNENKWWMGLELRWARGNARVGEAEVQRAEVAL